MLNINFLYNDYYNIECQKYRHRPQLDCCMCIPFFFVFFFIFCIYLSAVFLLPCDTGWIKITIIVLWPTEQNFWVGHRSAGHPLAPSSPWKWTRKLTPGQDVEIYIKMSDYWYEWQASLEWRSEEGVMDNECGGNEDVWLTYANEVNATNY